MDEEPDCKCIKILGHLEEVKWINSPRQYKPSSGHLALGDWKQNPHIWLYYVESTDGLLMEDDVLRSTDSRYWCIHDVQRYFPGQLHCEEVLFTYQYPSLKLPSLLATYLWKANVSLKLPPKLYMKELHMSVEDTLKKMEMKRVQMNRLLISDQLIKIDRLDYFKRKTFFRILQNIISFQDKLQLVSFENLCCKRLEGVRLIQQLACFVAHSLKYLFLWRFVLPNENPILINYSYIKDIHRHRYYGDLFNKLWFIVTLRMMATDEEKFKIVKLLEGINVPEVKISQRCLGLVKEFQEKYSEEFETEHMKNESYENPYVPDKHLLEENGRKLKELLEESHRAKKEIKVDRIITTASDPKRPWRTNSNKEKLFRIDNELKQHIEKSNIAITPMEEEEMKHLIKECREETLNAPCVDIDRLKDTVAEARRSLPNFQYRTIDNSTATAILPEAHGTVTPTNPLECSGQHILRPQTRHCFLRSLGELRQLRILALEYAHIADGTGNALLSLLPVIRRPHFRLQLICRENQTPGKADARLGIGGYDIPDTAWRRVTTSCPDLYLFMAFFRIRDYDNVRRFLTPSVPLRETHLQLGVDLDVSQRQDSDISCFMRSLAYYYADSLVTLSIHQWRAPELPLRRVLELMPRLTRLFYTGRCCEQDLRNAFTIVACGVCEKLKQINIQIQDDDSKRIYWTRTVEVLTEQYKDVMQLFDIKFSLEIYKC